MEKSPKNVSFEFCMVKLIFLLVFEFLAPKMAKTILANTNVDVLARKFKYLDLKTNVTLQSCKMRLFSDFQILCSPRKNAQISSINGLD